MKRTLFFLLILLVPALVHALQVDPAAYDFGTVAVGETGSREFRLSNRGDDDLQLFSIALAEDTSFFRIAESTCGDRLREKANCRVRVEFAPLAVGSWATDLVIVSDDRDQSEEVVHLQGTGGAVASEPPITEPPPIIEPPTTDPPPTEPPTAEPPGGDPPAMSGLLIRDSVEPYDDKSIPFGAVPVGVAKRKIFQIGNRNQGEMEIFLTPPPAPFSIENDTCSGAKLDFMDSCSVEVVFTPTLVGDQSGAVTFGSMAPGENLISIALSGSGTASSADFPAPTLIRPENGESRLKDSVLFRWSNCRDATGKAANYRLHTGPQPKLPEMPIQRVSGVEVSLGFALGGLLFLCRHGRRGRQWCWVSLALLAACLIAACSEDIEDSSLAEVGNLAEESTYYWQVVAEYDDGIEAKSEIRSFTTR